MSVKTGSLWSIASVTLNWIWTWRCRQNNGFARPPRVAQRGRVLRDGAARHPYHPAPSDPQQPGLAALGAHADGQRAQPSHRYVPAHGLRIHEPEEVGTAYQTTRVTEAVRAAQAQEQRQPTQRHGRRRHSTAHGRVRRPREQNRMQPRPRRQRHQ